MCIVYKMFIVLGLAAEEFKLQRELFEVDQTNHKLVVEAE